MVGTVHRDRRTRRSHLGNGYHVITMLTRGMMTARLPPRMKTYANTRLAALLCCASMAACSNDLTDDLADAQAADAQSGLVPQTGTWRAQFNGTYSACEMGNSGRINTLRNQAVYEITSASSNTLSVIDGRGNAITSGCTATSPGTFDCPWTNSWPLMCDPTSTNPCTFTGDDSNIYELSRSLTFSFSAANAGTISATSTITCQTVGCASNDPCEDAATFTFAPFTESEVLQPTTCADESTMPPDNIQIETFIDFVNDSDAPITRYWLDWDSARVEYNAINPGETVRQWTAAGTSWLVEKSGVCQGIFTGTPLIGTVTIN